MIRFLHVADLHLDAPCRGLQGVPSELQDRFQDLTFKAFASFLSFVKTKRPDFVLFAGDVYNQEERSIRAQLSFYNGLCELAEQGISCFVVHGNHDPLSSTLKSVHWPEQVHIFGQDPELIAVQRKGQVIAKVAGVSHARGRETRNLARMLPPKTEDIFHIALLHCNLEKNTGHAPYAPCSREDLVALGYDYFALGHVHTRSIVQEDPWLVYPGNLQGLHINEPGPRGGCLVHVDELGHVFVEFVSFSVLSWETVEIDLSKVLTLDQVQELVLQTVFALQNRMGSQDLVLRLRLVGRTPLYSELKTEEARHSLLASLREQTRGLDPALWLHSMDYAILPPIDLNARRMQGDFVGRLLQESSLLKEKKPDSALHKVLDELFSHHRLKRVLPPITRQELCSLLEDAELLCLDLLEDENGH